MSFPRRSTNIRYSVEVSFLRAAKDAVQPSQHRTPEKVIIRCNNEHITKRSWQSARFDACVLQPWTCTPSACDCASDHRGATLRSPMIDLASNHASKTDEYMQALHSTQLDVKTCRNLSISIQPGNTFMTLLEAKKLATTAWITEMEILRLFKEKHTSVIQPLSTHSAVGTSHLDRDNTARDPLLQAMTDLHLPSRMHNPATQQHLQHIWAISNMRRLERALDSTSGELLGFTLRVYDDDDVDDDDDEPWLDYHAIGTFRHAQWLPFVQASSTWVRFVVAVGKTMFLSPDKYKLMVGSLEREVGQAATGGERWKTILETLGVGDCYEEWVSMAEGYTGQGKGYDL
ncbi:uncharacterized protein UV8b_07780 [Ustilaginoidea virens]|uniref:Uncharacterized protein n=1 Tax=Ustilaginoidea virens TaxID=1159556 RepID=A0A8E5HXM8_USTVR|nr:uncharacterized protein UV8b_07780 [Ustilaginoidea virens]QUC23539.1 hypothetical protein UV8b_07780 [Ustilaginoidea virens]